MYLYELSGSEEFTYLDGEVEGCEWRDLEEFKIITANPESHNFFGQGRVYFESLINSLEYVSLGLNVFMNKEDFSR